MAMKERINALLSDIANELTRNGFTVFANCDTQLNSGQCFQFQTHDYNRNMGITLTLTHWLRVVQQDGKWKLHIAAGEVFEAEEFDQLEQMVRQEMNVIIGICTSLKITSRKTVSRLR